MQVLFIDMDSLLEAGCWFADLGESLLEVGCWFADLGRDLDIDIEIDRSRSSWRGGDRSRARWIDWDQLFDYVVCVQALLKERMCSFAH